MKRVILRSVVIFVALAVIGQLVAFIVNRYFGGDADPYEDEFDIVNILGGSSLASRAAALRAGTVRTYFGGTELDLRDAAIAPGGAYLELTTCFGGTEVRVSPRWRVEVIGLPRAGGHEVSVTDVDDLPFDAPHLVIAASTLFGGLEVRATSDGDEPWDVEDAAAASTSTNGAARTAGAERLV